MNKNIALIIVAALVFIGFRMCDDGHNPISSIAGTYILVHQQLNIPSTDLRMEVLEDGRVRFDQKFTSIVGVVEEVVNGVFVVTFNKEVVLKVSANMGSKPIGYGPLIFDTNDNKMYWGYDDYANRDITKVWTATFRKS